MLLRDMRRKSVVHPACVLVSGLGREFWQEVEGMLLTSECSLVEAELWRELRLRRGFGHGGR